jgi:segregation and condensation protein A
MKESRAAKKPAASAKKGEPAVPLIADSELPADGGVRIALPGFEGPLDLMLHLIQEHELDILNIPIAFVTKKYLEYMDLMTALNIDIASEYLVMAATLAHIKSRMLLPTPPADLEDGEEEELDPRAELIKRLLEYQKYKLAGEELASRSVLGRDIFLRPPQPATDPSTAPLAPVGSFKLLEAFQKVLARTKIVVDHQIEFERFSLSDRINQLVDLLKGKGRVHFESLFDGQMTRPDLIVTFLALLELTRLRMTRLFQDGSLEPIFIEMVGEGDELTADGELRMAGDEPAPRKPEPALEPEPSRLPPLPELDEEEPSDEEEEFDVAKILAEAAAEEAEEKRLAAEARAAKKAAEAGLGEALTEEALAEEALAEEALAEEKRLAAEARAAKKAAEAGLGEALTEETQAEALAEEALAEEALAEEALAEEALAEEALAEEALAEEALAAVEAEGLYVAVTSVDDDARVEVVTDEPTRDAEQQLVFEATSEETPSDEVAPDEGALSEETPSDEVAPDEGVALTAAEAITDEVAPDEGALSEETPSDEVAPDKTTDEAESEPVFEATLEEPTSVTPSELEPQADTTSDEVAPDEGVALTAAEAITDEGAPDEGALSEETPSDEVAPDKTTDEAESEPVFEATLEEPTSVTPSELEPQADTTDEERSSSEPELV